MYFIYQGLYCGFIEVYVGDGRKQSLDEQFIGVFGRLSVAVRSTGKADQRAGQFVLQTCDISFFAANTGSSGTAFSSGCLLTLKTKHLSFH